MAHVGPAIEHDLKRLVEGKVLFDDSSRVQYSTAACLFEIVPLGCVVPQSAQDVSKLVRYCAKHGIPITGRGAGTSVAGAALGSGVVVDFSRAMKRILEIDVDRGWARVEPGVVLSDLNRELGPHGYFFPPDPSSGQVCTVGGMIQTNAGGAHSLKYGTTRDYVLELTAVLDSGEDARIRNERTTFSPQGRHGEIFRGLLDLLKQNGPVIAQDRPRSPKNSSGYHLYDVLSNGAMRLQRLVSGSEGTLCLVTEAKVSIHKRPRASLLAMLVYPDMDAAAEGGWKAMNLEPSALEIMDNTAIDVVTRAFPDHAALVGGRNAAVVLAEFEGDDARGLAARARRLRRLAPRVDIVPEQGRESVWRLRQAISPALERARGPRRSTRVVEDACVSPELVADYIRGLKRILRRYRVRAAIFGHLGSGNIHVNLFLDLSRKEDLRLMAALEFEVSSLVRSLRGSLSGEHGDGLLRAPELRRQFPNLYPLFEQTKRIWDPRGIFNPGKKLAPREYRWVQDLRASRRPGFETTGPFAPLKDRLLRCNGCGKCRRYCPLTGDASEFSAPRAKVNLLLAAGEERVEHKSLLGDPVFRGHLQTCLDCRLCLSECPAGVDLPAIAGEFLKFPVDGAGASG